MNKKIIIAVLVAILLLAACAPQEAPVIVVQAPPQQQQQQEQTVIIQEAPQPEPQVIYVEPLAPARWCGNVRESYLSPGMTVRVTTNPYLANRIRSGPSYNSTYLGSAPPGSRIYLLDGPYCDRGEYIYWHVQILDKDLIENRALPKSSYNSVYTAETDLSGTAWLR